MISMVCPVASARVAVVPSSSAVCLTHAGRPGPAAGGPAFRAPWKKRREREAAPAGVLMDNTPPKEVGFAARVPRPAKIPHRLWHIEVDHDAAAEPLRDHRGDRI